MPVTPFFVYSAIGSWISFHVVYKKLPLSFQRSIVFGTAEFKL